MNANQHEASQGPIARALHIHATNGLIRDWHPTTAGGWTVDLNGSDPIELRTDAAAHTFVAALNSAAAAAPPVVEIVVDRSPDEFTTFVDGELVPAGVHRRAHIVIVDAASGEGPEDLSPAARLTSSPA